MEQLIQKIYSTLQDYRADEKQPTLRISPERIKLWVNQFNENDRMFILSELSCILQKRYCSKDRAREFVLQFIEKMTNDLKYPNVQSFLHNAVFLDLQPIGKSQKKILELINELIQKNYGMSLLDCGSIAPKHFIYVDDILCTGNTLFQDIKEWAESSYVTNKTHLQAIENNEVDVTFVYLFLHIKNYRKKKAEFKNKLSAVIANKHRKYCLYEVDNSSDYYAVLDFVFPIDEVLSQIILDYKDKIIEEVDAYTISKAWKKVENDFFRTKGKPKKEVLFSSPENRIRFETIMLLKGIEILNNANTKLKTIRALGYSLPSQKNFGFGALYFTWRNVANNTPLVFWYRSSNFMPLFEKNQTNS